MKPFVFGWESNTRDCLGRRVVKYRVWWPKPDARGRHWDSKIFKTEAAANAYLNKRMDENESPVCQCGAPMLGHNIMDDGHPFSPAYA
jgi:hypothetical protein